MKRLLPSGLAALAALCTASTHAAAPGISGGNRTPTFDLIAAPAAITQPDGQSVYSWGYGCNTQPSSFVPSNIQPTGGCPSMQIPGPTLVVTEGDLVTVTLHNGLPTAAGNTSILFPGFTLTSTCPTGQQGLLTCEAPPGGTVTYTFVAGSPGTRAYYSGTQGDLQVEMGLFGAIIVLPISPVSNDTSTACQDSLAPKGANAAARAAWGEKDFRLSSSAYDHPATCYDREYLFQFSEMDPLIHSTALAQVTAKAGCTAGTASCTLNVPTEPYHPAYFMINGRSMPDDMDPNYAPMYPNQPYNGNPHMHPGEITLLRIIGQGRWQHPFHEHANHVRILARDGNLLLTAKNNLAGPLMFTTTTTPGVAMDGLFYYTGKGLNWDLYGHNPGSADPNATLSCTPDANGYNTGAPTAINYFEWCQDHDKPMQVAPFGDVPSGGPVTLPDPNIFKNGAWYGGSPYLGPDATTRATFGTCSGTNSTTSCSSTGTTPPSGTVVNPPSSEAGFAFMWHS
ncbi:MAG: multicopper oxidase family protein, partial [Sinobacteraceae bacterium]|nr:multicopper oxidase family protein [Nevskiaceae bacterium]